MTQSQCWNKIRDDRIKTQREEQNKKEVENKAGSDLKTVAGSLGLNFRAAPTSNQQVKDTNPSTLPQVVTEEKQNSKGGNQNNQVQQTCVKQLTKRSNGITINEPSNDQQRSVVEEVPGKGKGKIDDITGNNSIPYISPSLVNDTNQERVSSIEANDKIKKRNKKKKKRTVNKEVDCERQVVNNSPTNTTDQDNGQGSGTKEVLTQKENEQDSDQEVIFQRIENVDSQNIECIRDREVVHAIDPGDMHNNYLKLISGTSLEDGQNVDDDFEFKPGDQSDSPGEEGNSSEDMDYEDEMNSQASGDYANVDSEGLHSEKLSDNQEDWDKVNSDDHANISVDTFCTQALVDVTVTSAFDSVINNVHLSPRGRGRGCGNTRGGRQSIRGRDGRQSKQQPVITSLELYLSS